MTIVVDWDVKNTNQTKTKLSFQFLRNDVVENLLMIIDSFQNCFSFLFLSHIRNLHLQMYSLNIIICMFFSANLSESYFTNRQDRYIHFRDCPEMANYLADLTKAVTSFSFQLQSDDTTTVPQDAPHPFLGIVKIIMTPDKIDEIILKLNGVVLPYTCIQKIKMDW